MLQLRTAALIAVATLARPTLAEHVLLTELPDHATEGVVTVGVPPAEIYRVVTDYASWPRVFTDTSEVRVVRNGRNEARVQFRSKALGHVVEVDFENLPNREIRFHAVKAPAGSRADGVYALVPVDGGRHTRVVARIALHVGGMARLLVDGGKVEAMRRDKLQRDLDDLARYFATRSRGA